MKKINFCLMMVLGLTFIHFNTIIYSKENITMEMVKNIHWLGQAAVKITVSGKTIYIDPYQIKVKDEADIILITHSHGDHLSPKDIDMIITEKTIIVAPGDCLAELKNITPEKTIISEPGMSKQVDNILIEAVPAYNVVKTNFHPKENRWVGYILTINGIKIYHAGDTERIPEMKNFSCDIALLPLGQTYTMNSVKEATQAAIDVNAKVAIPIHYGLYEGKAQDAVEFKKILNGIVKVIIKEQQ